MSTELPKLDLVIVKNAENAFMTLARFRAAACDAGWLEESVKDVLEEATSGDYDHLLATIRSHCKNP